MERMHIAVRGALAAAIALLLAAGAIVAGDRPAADALSGSQFDPSFIVSDETFFDANAMSADQIQAFLVSRVPRCTGANGQTCLRDYRTDTYSRAAVASRHCGPYEGAPAELASTIIFKVAQACNINPKVLLVTLEKERGLISKTSPNATDYRIAMGFGCPDTAPCDAAFYGFYNQMYKAAWQFRQYTYDPGRWRYKVGAVAVQYHPNASCGSTVVNIRNQATANLYNYTPYQPNAAALGNLYGTGDRCSSYGNRNFWRMFSDWFGNPAFRIDPMMALDRSDVTVAASGSAINLRGWAIDPAAPTSQIQVHAYVTQPDGVTQGYPITADQSRPDVAAVYGGAGDRHGFSAAIPISQPGAYRTCLYSIRSTGPLSYGCQFFVATQSAPFGSLDTAEFRIDASAAKLELTGWTIDSIDRGRSIDVHAYVTTPSGATRTAVVKADLSRPDVGAAHSGAGVAHGFRIAMPVTESGSYRICVYGIGTAALGANNGTLACRSVELRPNRPIGSLDSLRLQRSGDTVSWVGNGWALDLAQPTAASQVHVYVTDPSGRTVGRALSASTSRPDVARVYPSAGAAHGFDWSTPLTAQGRYRACFYSVAKTGPIESNAPLGCHTATFGPSDRRGSFDALDVDQSARTLTVRAWGLDLGSRGESTQVHFYVTAPGGGTTGYPMRATASRPDVAAAFPGAGAAHGVTASIPAPSTGSYAVCAYAIASPIFGSASSPLGCRTATVR